MPLDPAFAALAKSRFVSLTTFRKSGERVSTPVWIALDGEDLVVTTPVGSGKVKRLRNDERVELQTCGRLGKVKAGAPVISGAARILEDPVSVNRLTDVVKKKYGIEYHVIMGIERIATKESADRLILRISPAPVPAT